MLARQPRRAIWKGALFIRLGEKDHVAGEWNLPLGEHHRGAREDGHSTFEVHRASAEDMIAGDDSGERIDGPLVSLDADDVGVRGDEHGALGAVALEARDEVHFARVRRLDDLDVEAARAKPGRQGRCHLSRDAGRIAAVRPNEVDEQRCCGIDGLCANDVRRGEPHDHRRDHRQS